MKKLIFVCGPSGIGKSTACRKLCKTMDACALVDSDWCRFMNPFSFTEENKDMVVTNLSTLLLGYLRNSGAKNVIFLYGFHGPRKQLFDRVMALINESGIPYAFVPMILECGEEENLRRSRADGRDEDHIRYFMAHTRPVYDAYDYHRIDVTALTVEETVERMAEYVESQQ